MRNRLEFEDLGRMSYAEAYAIQSLRHEEVLSARPAGVIGVVLLVEHDPVITVTRRPGVSDHVVATHDLLRREGVEVAETDRGGDVTYHGPGQLVVYPIVDLNRLNCRIVEYLRVLEEIVIGTLGELGVRGCRDAGATGVWVDDAAGAAKVCAMGVRVRRWVTMHGLALNVDPDLSHFGLIVPCGLHGREVTSLRRILGQHCPGMERVKALLGERMRAAFESMADRADRAREVG